MKKFHKPVRFLSQLLPLILGLGLLSPTPVAMGAETVTKNINVKGSDGANLPGALVRFVWFGDSQVEFSSLATTDGNGDAAITLTKNVEGENGMSMVVMPPSGDTANAYHVTPEVNSSTDSTINVNLPAADALVELINPDGSGVVLSETERSAVFLIQGPGAPQEGLYPLRSGAFGVSLSSLASDANYRFALVQYLPWSKNRFSSRYAFKLTGSAPRTLTVYGGMTTSFPQLEPEAGVYKLRYTAGNVGGYLVGPDGSSLTFGPEVSGSLCFFHESDPAKAYCWPSLGGENSDGRWFGQLTGPAGRYDAKILITGSLTIPTFQTSLWKSESGQIKTSIDGEWIDPVDGFVSVNIKHATPNLKFRIVNPGPGSVPISSGFEIFDAQFENSIAQGWANNGLFSGALPDGQYGLVALPEFGTEYSEKNFQISITGGIASIEGVTPTEGVFDLPLAVSNFRYRIIGPDGNGRGTGYIDYCRTDENFSRDSRSDCRGNGVDQDGNGATSLADGTYLLEVRPGQGILEAVTTVELTVSNGVVSYANSVIESGRFILSTTSPNLVVHAKNPNGSTLAVGNNQGVVFELQKLIGQDFQGLINYYSSSSSMAFKVTGDGTYRVVVRPENFQGLNEGRSSEFTVDNGIFRVSGSEDGYASLTGAYALNVNLTESNFNIKLINPSGGAVLNGWVSVLKEVDSGYDGFSHINVDGAGNGNASIPTEENANYLLEVNSAGFARSYYDLTVTGGTLQLSKGGQAISKNQADSRYYLSPTVANITGLITDDTGNPPVQGNNKHVNANLQKWVDQGEGQGYWDWVPWNGSNVDDQGQYFLNVSQPGKFRVIVQPNGFDNLGATPSSVFTVTQSGENLLFAIEGGASGLQSLTGENKMDIRLTSSNFKIKLVNPDTQEPTFGWVGIQKERPEGGYNWQGNINVNNSGLGGATLGDGTYRLEVNTDGFARKNYNLVVAGASLTLTQADGTPVVAQSDRFTISAAIANLNGTIKSTSGSTLTLNQDGKWVSFNLQRQVDGNWQYTNDWTGADNSGNFKFNVSTPGTYRVLAQPNGIDGATTAVSDTFSFDGTTFTKGESSGITSLTGANALVWNLATPNFRIKLVNPDNSDPLTQGWISILKVVGDSSFWVANIDIHSGSNGNGGASLAEGTYRLEVNTNLSGYARSFYTLSVDGSGNPTLSRGATEIEAISGVFNISPSKPNVTGRILDSNSQPLGSMNNKWVGINVQKYNETFGNWDWTSNWANTNPTGYFAINVTEPGKYRLRIEPNGFTGVTTSYSDEFTVVTGSETFSFNNFKLGAPSLMIKVALEGSTTPLNFIGIELRRNGNWLDWIGTGPSGVAAISLKEEGVYQVVVHPSPAQTSLGAARKTYEVVATKSGQTISASVSGATETDGVYLLTLGSGNVKGIVKNVSNAPVGNVPVVAREISTNRDLWEFGAQSSADGKWSMSLPAGEYKIIAMQPWGSTLYGGSEPSANVVVNASGVATEPGNALNMTLVLSNPRWAGVVQSPTGDPVAFASINLYNNGTWTGATANAAGEFALAVAGFTAFSEDAFLEIRDDRAAAYPMRRWQGGSAVSTALNGLTADNVVLSFAGSNFTVLVRADGQPAANVWVNIDADNVGWIGGGRTNASGQAKFNVDAALLDGGNFRIRADVNGNATLSANYASSQKTLLSDDVETALGSGPYQTTLDLKAPNLRAELREPASAGGVGNVASNAWVELFDAETGAWVNGAGTDQNGLFSLSIDVAKSYILTVNPSWNSNSNVSKNQYNVVVADDLTVSVTTRGASPQSVTSKTISGRAYKELSLSTPSVRGTVVKSGGVAVRDSWVVPINNDTGEYMWQFGTNSKANGSFALALPAGNYRLEANVPWGSANLAKSSPCDLTVGADGTITGSACEMFGGLINLTLREPNLTFTLKKDAGESTAPVSYAWVGVCIERWCSGGQSNKDGLVSIFIDSDAIDAVNNYTTPVERDIWLNVEPPYGSSDVARLSCASGDAKQICSSLSDYVAGSDYPEMHLGDILLSAPNFKLFVSKPAGAGPLQNSWVSLFDGTTGNWLGGANTDANGRASFNIENYQERTYRIEVNAPWNSTQYSRKMYGQSTPLTADEVNNQTFEIGAPNLLVAVGTAIGTVNKWGWINLEVLDGENYIHVGGYGLNVQGTTAIALEGDKTYRITSYPGPGAVGTRSVCVIETNAEGVIDNLLDCAVGNHETTPNPDRLGIELGSGNYRGNLQFNGSNVSGAVVIANFEGGNESTQVKAVSNAAGDFKLLLDPALATTWQIRVVPTKSIGGVEIAVYTYSVTAGSVEITPEVEVINLVAVG
jgi:hypothetical protein